MHFSPAPMHIPDGFLSIWVSLACWVFSVIGIGLALKRVSQDLGERQVPMMGVLAAAIFAGQMLNFTVVGGTSGHLMGAALATILLGPWASILILTCVVAIQALIFQDGGLVVLGANMFNMAIIGSTVAYMVYWSVQKLAKNKPWGLFVGGFLAAWSSIVIAALATSLELAISGTSPANIAVPVMAGMHALIGIGEGLITVGALAFIYTVRRDLLHQGGTPARGGNLVWIVGLIIALALAILSPLASAFPDGLEWVAEQKGFLDTAQSPLFKLIPDYVFPGIKSETAATIIAGIVGMVIVFSVALLVAHGRRKRKIDND